MNFKKYLLALPLAALLFASCDEIAADDRYIPVEEVTPTRTVLLEEFTGQWCMNCPDGHAVIKALKEQYGSAFIAVSIHAGPDVNSWAEEEGQEAPYVGLRQPEGVTYGEMWGVKSFPCGVFNRTSGVLDRKAWASAIVSELTKPTDLTIKLEASYDKENDKVNISTELWPTADIKGNLQLWVVESGINAIQLNGYDYDETYIHDDVFRCSVNGTQGEAVTLKDNISQSFEHSIARKARWNAENLSIVAFVYNDSGVLNAIEAHVAYHE
jgi:Outer membrane protein Omp28